MFESSNPPSDGRPLLLVLLGSLNVVVGFALILTAIMISAVSSREFRSHLPMSQGGLVWALGLIGIWILVSGGGLLRGAIWGWWLTIAFCVYMVVNSTLTWIQLPELHAAWEEMYGPSRRSLAHLQGRYLAQALGSVITLLYLNRQRVLSFFTIDDHTLGKRIMIIGSMALGSLFLIEVLTAWIWP